MIQDLTKHMISLRPDVEALIAERGYEVSAPQNYLYTFISGLKTEWHHGPKAMRVGHRAGRTIEELEKIKDHLEEYGFTNVQLGKTYVDVKLDQDTCNVESFSNFMDTVESMEELGISVSSSNSFGVSFEGTNFSNAHERATTIGNRFMKMVCKAADMSDNYDSEWGTDDAGRIDAVEIDEETENPIAIYECQSGIQYGDYLDNEHVYKALLRYPSDPEIAPTLKKIVILAGGYTKEHLDTIKWQAENLKIARGIEVILLKTTRTENKIGVERVNF